MHVFELKRNSTEIVYRSYLVPNYVEIRRIVLWSRTRWKKLTHITFPLCVPMIREECTQNYLFRDENRNKRNKTFLNSYCRRNRSITECL